MTGCPGVAYGSCGRHCGEDGPMRRAPPWCGLAVAWEARDATGVWVSGATVRELHVLRAAHLYLRII